MAKNNKYTGAISKENFIEFLANATPEEVNELIKNKGKPRKLIEPFVFFKSKSDDKQE